MKTHKATSLNEILEVCEQMQRHLYRLEDLLIVLRNAEVGSEPGKAEIVAPRGPQEQEVGI